MSRVTCVAPLKWSRDCSGAFVIPSGVEESTALDMTGEAEMAELNFEVEQDPFLVVKILSTNRNK